MFIIKKSLRGLRTFGKKMSPQPYQWFHFRYFKLLGGHVTICVWSCFGRIWTCYQQTNKYKSKLKTLHLNDSHLVVVLYWPPPSTRRSYFTHIPSSFPSVTQHFYKFAEFSSHGFHPTLLDYSLFFHWRNTVPLTDNLSSVVISDELSIAYEGAVEKVLFKL